MSNPFLCVNNPLGQFTWTILLPANNPVIHLNNPLTNPLIHISNPLIHLNKLVVHPNNLLNHLNNPLIHMGNPLIHMSNSFISNDQSFNSDDQSFNSYKQSCNLHAQSLNSDEQSLNAGWPPVLLDHRLWILVEWNQWRKNWYLSISNHQLLGWLIGRIMWVITIHGAGSLVSQWGSTMKSLWVCTV